MSKLIQAASIVALVAATSTANAWYAPAYPVPTLTQEQRETMAAQQKAMLEQRTKAMEQAMAAQRQFVEQQAAHAKQLQETNPGLMPFGGYPLAFEPGFPELPPIPEIGDFPAIPEMPAMPTLGYPAGPESLQKRLEEMDAYRAQAQKQMDERQAAMKRMHEQRRAMYPRRAFAHRGFSAAPGLYPAMPRPMTSMPAQAPDAQQQAAAPVEKSTATQ